MVFPNSARHALVLLSLLLLAFGQTACSTTRTSQSSTSSGYGYGAPVSLSALLARPLSWEKLDDLEAWIDQRGYRASDRDRNEARLALAEGRAAFARKDLGNASAAVLKMRGERARSDFQLVLSDSGASSAQRGRAHNGIAQLGGSNVYTTAAAAPTGATSLSIISRSSWGASTEVPRHMSRHLTPWSKITVHHTAMPLGSSTSLPARCAEMRTIQRSHLNKAEGWGDVGYHYLIDPEGRIYEGRRLAWRGAHVGGQNDHNLGVSLMGNYDVQRPSRAALASLGRLIDDLRATNGIPRNQVTYHREWPTANTECPGTYVVPWVEAYRGNRTASTFTGSSQVATPRRSYAKGVVR